MKHHHPNRHSRGQNRTYWIVGLGSLIWLLLRSGTNPRRLAYPCQRAALASSSGFLGYLVALLGAVHLYRVRQHKAKLAASGLFLLLALTLTGSSAPTTSAAIDLDLPGWTSPSAVSNVFVVPDVAVPECSLDGGALPGTPPCNDPNYALRDAGVDQLVDEMERQRDYFYRTASHPDGIVGADDVVVVKINDQWGGRGDGNGAGRLSTNTDLLKGLIWRILGHPDGFTGEVVVAENTQDVNPGWGSTPANAEDPNQSYQDVVNTFQGLGYAVSFFNWDTLNRNLVSGGPLGGTGTYPSGEYVNGDIEDAYILLEDPDGPGKDELSYPKFQTENGSYVSMRYGTWDGSSYDGDRLTFINVPVLKKHVIAGSTIAWKNLIGFVTIMDYARRYGSPGDPDWISREKMHGFFWGYADRGSRDYGLIGRELALVRPPDLNVVDAIWVAIDHNSGGNALRRDVLLASRDPFAVDWYASEYVLRPSVSWGMQDSSAARRGTFRDATRTNQNAAQAMWPGGVYPYMDLLDGYDGDVPSDDEKNQMNVYLATGASVCEAITGVGISGPAVGFADTPSFFSAVITPSNASTPITYTWSPEPDSGQATAIARYEWGTRETYSVTLEAENCGGGDSATHDITITDAQWHIYLPLALKNLTGSSSGWWRPSVDASWQWQLTALPIDRSFDVDVYDIDLFDNDASTVAALHAEGRRVICYVSVGSWEEWRPDANQFPASVLGNDYDGWPGEKWLDIRQIDTLAPIMRARLDQCQAKGFDGVEPDNVDAYTNDTGFPLTYQDQLEYNTWLADKAHARGLSIGLKNDGDQVADLLTYFDWALTEDCFADEWCEQMGPFITAGKAVFAAEYTDQMTAGQFSSQVCPQAATLSFSAILKKRDLDAWRQACP